MSLTDLNRIDKIVDDMIAIKSDIDNDIEARDNRITTVEKKLEDIISVNASLSAPIKAKGFKIDVREMKIDDINDNDKIRSDLRKLEKKLEEVINNNKAKDFKIARIENELSEISEMKFKTNNTKINDLKIISLDKEMEEKKAKIIEMEKKLEDIISDNTGLSTQTRIDEMTLFAQKNQIANLSRANNELKKKIDLLEKKHKEEILKLKNDIEHSETTANQAAGGDETFKKKITELENKLEAKANEEKKSKTTIKNLKVLGKVFREKSAIKDKEFSEKSEAVENLEKEITEVKGELEKTKKKLEEASSPHHELLKLKIENERLTKENEEIIRKGKEKDDKIKTIMTSMKTKLIDVRKENKSLLASLEGKESKVDSLEKEITVVKEELEQPKKDLEEANSLVSGINPGELIQLKTEKERLLKENEELKKKGKEKDEYNKNILTKVVILTKENEQMKMKMSWRLPVQQDEDEDSEKENKKRKLFDLFT